jgi:hypothetical protein
MTLKKIKEIQHNTSSKSQNKANKNKNYTKEYTLLYRNLAKDTEVLYTKAFRLFSILNESKEKQ